MIEAQFKNFKHKKVVSFYNQFLNSKVQENFFSGMAYKTRRHNFRGGMAFHFIKKSKYIKTL